MAEINKTLLNETKKNFKQLNKHFNKFEKDFLKFRPLKNCEYTEEWENYPDELEKLMKEKFGGKNYLARGLKDCLKKKETLKQIFNLYENNLCWYVCGRPTHIMNDIDSCIEGLNIITIKKLEN